MGTGLVNKAKALFLKGDYQEAIQLAEQGLAIHQRNKDKLLEGFASLIIGILLLQAW